MEDARLAEAARALLNRLVGAVQRQLRYADTLALAFSGGLDSAVLARLLAERADVPVYAVTASRAGAKDAQRARTLARALSLPHIEVAVGRQRFLQALPELARLAGRSPVPPSLAAEWGTPDVGPRVNPVRVAMLAPIYFAAQEARLHARRLILGQGADELLAGYARHAVLELEHLPAAVEADLRTYETEVRPIEDRVAERFGLQFRYPYLDPGVAPWLRLLPPELMTGPDGTRKRVLREVARLLSLPAEVVDVPKTAAQYGSGFAPFLEAAARDAGLAQTEFLTRLLAPSVRGRA